MTDALCLRRGSPEAPCRKSWHSDKLQAICFDQVHDVHPRRMSKEERLDRRLEKERTKTIQRIRPRSGSPCGDQPSSAYATPLFVLCCRHSLPADGG